jgi:hypothetical protein
MQNESYVSQIDTTDFGLFAGYLRSKQSPIQCLLNVKEPDHLVTLAKALDRELAVAQPTLTRLPLVVEQAAIEGVLKLSLRDGINRPDTKFLVEPSRVPREAACQVIFYPPFYLVHTPGLFDGSILKPEPSEGPKNSERPAFLKHLEKLGSHMKP